MPDGFFDEGVLVLATSLEGSGMPTPPPAPRPLPSPPLPNGRALESLVEMAKTGNLASLQVLIESPENRDHWTAPHGRFFLRSLASCGGGMWSTGYLGVFLREVHGATERSSGG